MDKERKGMNYVAPEMEILKLWEKVCTDLVVGSGPNQEGDGENIDHGTGISF